MKIGVVGGIARDDKEFIRGVLDSFCKENDTIVSGGAGGVDTIAEEFADWKKLKKSIHLPTEKNGGYRGRNSLIAKECDILLAFPSATSTGTYDTIYKVKTLSKRYIVFI